MTSHARPRPTRSWAVPLAVVVLLAGGLAWLVVSSMGGHSRASARPGTTVVLASGRSAARVSDPVTLTPVPPVSIPATSLATTGGTGAVVAAASSSVSTVGEGSSTGPGSAPSTGRSTEITYTVRPGDNLTVIATWFHQHGYQPIYDWNRTVIGQNPDLIKPGQVFIVAIQGTP